MRIAVFIKSTTFHKGYGGFETQNKGLCEGLVSRGHSVCVYTPQKEIKESEITENGVLYRFIPCIFGNFKALSSRSKESWENKSRELFLKDHKDLPYDLVIGQSSWALPIIRIKNDLKIKIISIAHGSKMGEYQTEIRNTKSMRGVFKVVIDLPHVLRTFFGSQREFIHGSDHIVAVSSFVKKAIIEETYVEEKKITVIRNGVDSKKIMDLASNIKTGEAANDSNVIKIIYVGRIIRAKGLYILLSALKRLHKNNLEVKIIGSGEDKEDLERKFKENITHIKFYFTGHMNYEDVLKNLIQSDIFVLPSLRMEGFPMTLVEAMLAGVPIIASDIGGNSDAVENDVNGYLVKPGDISALSEKINILSEDRNLRVRLGNNGRTKALLEFTIDRMLDKYEEVFREILR
ncbi:MAG TPA: glycosyltransferase family 4 protein [bacterium]|nr:glycosyltransferase family 4 protein [bacterium]HOA18625.1 glycosyltransferase family 4 protein [bacterium]